MSAFTKSAQTAYNCYEQASGSGESVAQETATSGPAWDLKTTLRAILPFLQANGGNLDAMPGLREAFEQAEPQEWQAMWTEYCHLGDLLYRLENSVKQAEK